MTENEIKDLMLDNIATETPLRVWKRRLIVALTKEEKEKCKAKIKEYERIYDR
jgi:hypothetical protein